VRRELLYLRHVVPVVVALADAERAPEVVERDGCVSAFGEPECELLVEAVEPADVREDDDAGRARPAVRDCAERRELVAVLRVERQVLVRDGRAGDDGDRR
jgi:hypothetical protein